MERGERGERLSFPPLSFIISSHPPSSLDVKSKRSKTSDPYFNEPGYEAQRGTPSGDEASARYNAQVSLDVVRHAMNGMLDSPPPGFEEVVKQHFKLVGFEALEAAVEAAKAAKGSAGAALAAQLRAEVEGLRGRLAKLLAE